MRHKIELDVHMEDVTDGAYSESLKSCLFPKREAVLSAIFFQCLSGFAKSSESFGSPDCLDNKEWPLRDLYLMTATLH